MNEELELGVKFKSDTAPAARAANQIERIAESARKAKAELAKLERQSSGAKQFRAVDGVAVLGISGAGG